MQTSLATVIPIEQERAPAEAMPVRRSPYLVHPLVDGLLVCGGLPWIFGLWLWLYPPARFGNSQWLVSALFTQIVVLVFNNAHTGATWLRMYANQESRRRFSFHAKWLVIPSIALAVGALYMPALSAALLKIYVLWVPQHYIAQSYGLAMIYCGRSGFMMTSTTRRWLRISLWLLTAWAISNQLSASQMRSFMLEMPVWNIVPMWLVVILRGLCFTSLVIFAASLAEQSINSKRLPPWTFMLLIVSIVTFTSLTGEMAASFWMFVPPFFHGSQYVIVSGVFHMRERSIRATPTLIKNALAYSIAAAALGYLAYEAIPSSLDLAGFQYSLVALFSPINFHHFLTDRALWKLRDPKTRTVVVGRPH